MQSYEQAYAYIAALTGDNPDTAIVDLRAIHDTNKAIPALPRRGTLPSLWNEMVGWNNAGYGIFANINIMDGSDRLLLSNVSAIRTHAVDLDNLMAQQNYERAAAASPAPSFAVNSSPGKFHVYWPVQPYSDNERAATVQRKLRQVFDGDKSIIDPSRVLRVPGFYHLKQPQSPHLVTCWSLPGYGQRHDVSMLEAALQGVDVTDGGGGRHDLGDATLAAPSWAEAVRALQMIDPNGLDRAEWISVTAAFKQSAWTHAPEQQIYQVWCQWCAQYASDDPNENAKNWNSIRNSETGWKSFERRFPSLKAARMFAEKHPEIAAQQQAPQIASQTASPTVPPMQPTAHSLGAAAVTPRYGEYLSDTEQRDYFNGCVFIERSGHILTPSGRFMNSTMFNGKYGGHKFVVDSDGKTTNEPWQAATRSTLWAIPKADHIRFLPQHKTGELVRDALGRIGVNTFIPPKIDAVEGDVTPFLRHMQFMLPVDSDRKILFDYLAHNARFPGHKIPWAPLIQSTEGAGKNMLKEIIKHVMGPPYVYFPKAQELIQSGSKFNAWMRARLFILVDEIKVDERRDMIEILKPMISEKEIEIQAKGVDQELEDNFSNWAFFSNYKDAIPVNKNNRRFAIFYSAFQTASDLETFGLDKRYFDGLYGWLQGDGLKHVAHWLLTYPIERGGVPMRAPETSSTQDAIAQSRGPVETAILDAVSDGVQGFRGGWVSLIAARKRIATKTNVRSIHDKTIGNILEALGYHCIGRPGRYYFSEDAEAQTVLYALDRAANMDAFGPLQGYV